MLNNVNSPLNRVNQYFVCVGRRLASGSRVRSRVPGASWSEWRSGSTTRGSSRWSCLPSSRCWWRPVSCRRAAHTDMQTSAVASWSKRRRSVHSFVSIHQSVDLIWCSPNAGLPQQSCSYICTLASKDSKSLSPHPHTSYFCSGVGKWALCIRLCIG